MVNPNQKNKTIMLTSTKKKVKKGFLSNSLLLKQTLVATWKSKLQLVILLLLTTFTTALITGSWISYTRMIDSSNELGLNNLNYDAVLPYSSTLNSSTQIANQAFSLKLGKIYSKEKTGATSSKALYFDNTTIGQEINNITINNINIEYERDNFNKIIAVKNVTWVNKNNPLTFNLKNINVEASMYGQLLQKATNALNVNLRNHFEKAANNLYQNIFVKITAPQILDSITKYVKEYVKDKTSSTSKLATMPDLTTTDIQMTKWILKHKINYQGKSLYDFPLKINLLDLDDKSRNDLFTNVIVGKYDPDPRVNNAPFGMNGQWMRIYRDFKPTETKSSIYTNFQNHYYSPYNYNQMTDGNDTPMTDGNDTKAYSLFLAQGAAALQLHDIHVRNQFIGSAGFINDKQVNIKVIDIGLPNAINHTNITVFEGVAPSSANELLITPQYARWYHYKPGNHLTINDNDFIITGIGGDAYDIYPIINDSDPVPNTRTEFIAYVTLDAWNNNNWYQLEDKTDVSLMYFTPWTNVNALSFDTHGFNDYFQKTIFNNNGVTDLNQDSYNQYLINKDQGTNSSSLSFSYKISDNPVVTKDNQQFMVYSGRKIIFNATLIGFKSTALVGVAFLLIIVVFITTLIVKKAIQHGQVSMGILKSIGYKTWQIVASYLAYPLVTLFVAIPIGWFVGLGIQIYLTEIFNTVFVLPYNVINFDIAPLFVAIGLIIGFITIATLATAFRILKKDVLLLIKKDSDLTLGAVNGKASSFFKNHFRWRFALSLSKTSWKKIAMTTSVITLATLSIVATTAIPATINSLKTNYFKSQKYQNYYQYQTPMPNMPLSKYGLYSWNYYDKPNDEKYYPVYGAMPWPENKIIYENDQVTKKPRKRIGWYNPLDFKKTGATINFNGTNSIFTFDEEYTASTPERNIFLDKMDDYYQSKDNGTLDINDLIWSYTWLGGKAFSNQMLLDLAKQDQTPDQSFSSAVTTFASTQLPDILSVPNPGVPAGPDAIKEILKQVLPGYVRQSLENLPKKDSDKDPYNYFAISHNTVAFNPSHNDAIGGPNDELVTQFKIGSSQSSLVKKGFMDVVGINPNTAMLVLASNEASKLRYQANAKEIPMIINRAFQARYNLKTGDTFRGLPNINLLFYLNNNNQFVPLPKNNWFYGDNPPTTINPQGNGDGIWSKNGTKWNYRSNKNIPLPNEPDSYSDIQGTQYNGMYNRMGKPIINKNPSEWNNINKIWLKLPDDINNSVKSGTIRKADGIGTATFNSLNNIAKKGDANWIKPFSYSFIEQNDDTDPIILLKNRTPEWFMAMIDQDLLIKKDSLSTTNLQADIENMPRWWKEITGETNPISQYRIVGIQNSYDSPKAYVDQKWANKIVGYSSYNDNPCYEGTEIEQWFNGKLSANENVFDLIGRMSFKTNVDDYTIYSTTKLKGNENIPMIVNSDLLARKKSMLEKMASIAFSASVLFVVTTIMCSILIVIMITDLFTNQFRRFMAHMKAEGYTNWEINSFTLGIFTPWVLMGYILGFVLGFLLVYVLVTILGSVTTIALPFTITWWILPASFIIIAAIYISTFVINNNALKKMNLIELLKSDE